MKVYSDTQVMKQAIWPGPMEPVWQMLPARGEHPPGCKRPDLTIADRLFISAVVNIPAEQRCWGSITWLAKVFDTSRPTVYEIGERGRKGIQGEGADFGYSPNMECKKKSALTVQVTANRIKRTILTLMLPGKVSGRSMDECLEAALEVSRSNATVSHLLHEAGRKAGEVLSKVDWSPLGPVVLARDELFTGRNPNLLLVEPHSLTITGLYAAQDREAETWACALLIAQDQGLQIAGLAEDGCIPYAASCREAGLDTAIQRDIWHAVYDTIKVKTSIRREARKTQKEAAKLEKQLTTKRWTDDVFEKWCNLIESSEASSQLAERLHFWQGCLWDAVEVVDLRSGEIRDTAINNWLLNETLAGIRQLDHPRIQKLADKLEAQAPDLLTFLQILEQPLLDWQTRTARHFPDPQWALFFQSTVARLWRLEHAVRNGHQQFAQALSEVQQWVAEFVADDPTAHSLAQDLHSLLDRVVRTSCAAEAVNSVLRPYFNSRRESTDQTSRQLFLNLFWLWFNMHKFDRGPRSGKSPFQLAGIDLGTDDWLTLLGYPPD